MTRRAGASTLRLAAAAFVIAGAAGAAVWVASQSPAAQTRTSRASRTADGKPNLNGVWQAMSTAHWDLLDHSAQPGAVVALGALGAVPGGHGVVEGNEIPYKPEALRKKRENAANWLAEDPLIKCYMPGVPRATYLPFPFQIVQSAEAILIAYEFANASRTIDMKSTEQSPLDHWMGWSRGRWEGDTLVVDVTNFNDRTWFDAAGDYHSEALHVVERYTPTTQDHLMYEATIDDPNVFTRPWKIRMPLYRHVEANAELVEFRCVEFAEELMYGHLRRQTGN
jgi:hypothetical protein